jgi:hypothetical protein
MKNLVLLVLALLLASSAFANDTFDLLKKSDLYPTEYWITTDYNPGKDRDWQFGEVSNGFKWKIKNKAGLWIAPDEITLAWDYNPDKKRDWTCQEITTGVKWMLK